MPNILKITVENSEELLNAGSYGAGALVRIQWSATLAGVYADLSGTGSTPTISIVSGTEVYTGFDPTGTTSTFYRTRYESLDGTRASAWTSLQVGDASTSYVSLATFRVFVRNQATAAADVDADIELLALESAARAIDRECGRDFLAPRALEARTFTAGLSTADLSRYAVDIDDITDATGMTVAFDATGNGSYTTACTTYRLMPSNAAAHGMPWRALLFDTGTAPPLNEAGVQVTALWGWATVPAAVANANLIQAARFLKRRDSPFGVAGSPELGNELRLLAKLDPDVALLLRGYKLDWGYA